MKRLDWEAKIVSTCEQLGIDPEIFSEDIDLQEWMAKHFGFESYDSFFALATPKDIIGGMALSMFPDHHNYEYHLIADSADLIIHNYELYGDTERTRKEIQCLFQFMTENACIEMQIVAVRSLRDNYEIWNIVELSSELLTLVEKYDHRIMIDK